jgi:hypothetical protein
MEKLSESQDRTDKQLEALGKKLDETAEHLKTLGEQTDDRIGALVNILDEWIRGQRNQ